MAAAGTSRLSQKVRVAAGSIPDLKTSFGEIPFQLQGVFFGQSGSVLL